jgi:hypothetical protein
LILRQLAAERIPAFKAANSPVTRAESTTLVNVPSDCARSAPVFAAQTAIDSQLMATRTFLELTKHTNRHGCEQSLLARASTGWAVSRTTSTTAQASGLDALQSSTRDSVRVHCRPSSRLRTLVWTSSLVRCRKFAVAVRRPEEYGGGRPKPLSDGLLT